MNSRVTSLVLHDSYELDHLFLIFQKHIKISTHIFSSSELDFSKFSRASYQKCQVFRCHFQIKFLKQQMTVEPRDYLQRII